MLSHSCADEPRRGGSSVRGWGFSVESQSGVCVREPHGSETDSLFALSGPHIHLAKQKKS